MATDDKFIITADEAASLLVDGAEYIHNFVQADFAIIGCDFDREGAINAFKAAHLIEIGGSACKGMKHPIVVHEEGGRYSFFEADMAKVEALEASRALAA